MSAIETSKQIVLGGADKALLHNNANKASERIPVMKNMIAGEVIKEVGAEMLPAHVYEGHRSGDIHFHDLDESPFLPFYNCCLVNLKDMLDNGCVIGNAEIETPKSIATAAAVTAQIIAQVACHQYGGVSINRIDEILAPYVAKSYKKHLAMGLQYCESRDKAVAYATKMTHREVDSACQGLEYEVNTLFTSQGQTPFVTFGFGLGTSWQAKSIQKGILTQRINGLGKQKRTAIFPKLVYCIDKGINAQEGDPNYHDIRELAIECAAKRNYPDVLNMPALKASGGGCAPMGCRSFLHKWEDSEGNEVWDGRNNLGVASINIPRIAIQAASLEEFWSILDDRLALAKDALDFRVDRLRGVKAEVAPILYQNGALGRLNADDDIFQLFDNHRASVSLGYIGLHEAAEALSDVLGSEPALKNDAKYAFQQQVVKVLREATDEWNKTSDVKFGLYSTPSESLCDRFARLDEERFPDETAWEKGYYTNSFHLDVQEQVSPFTKFSFEAPFHKHASSGHISYVEVPNVDQTNRKIMLSTLWTYAYEEAGIPYHGQNCAIDKCHSCGWEGDAKASSEGFECGHCGNVDPTSMEITKRVCGYLGNTNARPFNKGKQREVTLRAKHL